MNKYKVYGRQKVEIEFKYTIEAISEDMAVSIAEVRFNGIHGTTEEDVIDQEIYCDLIDKKGK